MSESKIHPSLKKVLGYVLDADGSPSPRSKSAWRQAPMEKEIIGEIYAIVRRPVDLDDLNPAIAELLAKRWRERFKATNQRASRIQWFTNTHAVAVALGLSEQRDFSGVSVMRQMDWKKTRQALPEPTRKDRAKPGQPMQLIDLFTKHYRAEKLVGKSQSTLKQYRYCIRAFSKWLGRQAVVADLNTKTVCGFIEFLLTETELAPATVEKDRRQLVALWNFAARKGWLAEFPTIPSVTVPERVPDAWTDAEMKALLDACQRQQGTVGSVDASDFWTALVMTVYDTAERIGAVMQAKRSDLTGDNRLTIRGEVRKGGKRDKRFKLRPETVERLNRIRVFGRDELFVWPYSEGLIWRRYGRILEDAGLPNTRRTKLHKIRRTTASNFEAAGGNATVLLDHQSRKTTLGYLDPSVLKELQPVDVIPGIGVTKQEVIEEAADESDESVLAAIKRLLDKGKGAA